VSCDHEWEVYWVFPNLRANTVEVHATCRTCTADDQVVIGFTQESIQDLVEDQLGPPPARPGIQEMERMISRAARSRAEDHWVDPREEHRKEAVKVTRTYVTRFFEQYHDLE